MVLPKVIVRKTLSKTGYSYFIFITESGAEKVLAYLKERLASGEALTSESPVIAPSTKLVTHRGKHQGKIHDNISDRTTSKKNNETKIHVETVCVAGIL